MLFYTQAGAAQDIWQVTRASTDAEFANPREVAELNSSACRGAVVGGAPGEQPRPRSAIAAAQ
jgi:hypothetical protein